MIHQLIDIFYMYMIAGLVVIRPALKKDFINNMGDRLLPFYRSINHKLPPFWVLVFVSYMGVWLFWPTALKGLRNGK